MAVTTLPNSGLKYWDYSESGWLTYMNYNIQRLNDTLLKLSALLDVDTTGLSDGYTLWYVSASGKWEPRNTCGIVPETTTTTSTTTTSTTSSSTSTTSSTTTTTAP